MNKKDNKNTKVMLARLKFAFDSAAAFMSLNPSIIPDPEFPGDLCALIKQTIDAMNLLKADLCTAIPLADQELEECLEGLEDPLS